MQLKVLGTVVTNSSFLFLSFRRVLNVICSFLGNSPGLSSNCRRFGTHYRFSLHLPMKIEPIVISETSAIRTQTPGNYPKTNKLQFFFYLLMYFCFHASTSEVYIVLLLKIQSFKSFRKPHYTFVFVCRLHVLL